MGNTRINQDLQQHLHVKPTEAFLRLHFIISEFLLSNSPLILAVWKMRHPDSEGETQFAVIVFIFSVNYVYDECLYVYSTCDTTIHVYFDYVFIFSSILSLLFIIYYFIFYVYLKILFYSNCSNLRIS